MIKSLPNILTLGRLVLTVVFLLMILYSPQVERLSLFLDVAFVLFVVAGVTDVVDGHVARRFDATSKFGRIIDPLVDKVLVCGAFICFAIVGLPALFGWGPLTLAVIHWSVFAILFSREAYVTVLRHVAEAKGVNFAATKSGKFKMLTQVFAIGTVLIKTAHVPEAAWGDWFTAVIFVVMVAATIVSGFLATRRPGWRQFKKEEAGTHEPSTTST
ncbi:MAG: CDP-alcohol phosphatidyltransferase family protein [Sedimentisphaerales bacterium]|nr:CDP-alcohol phosphatidyltransferase family protein [Sedimentisphaerales bacterium]